jgi:hypothetical protein
VVLPFWLLVQEEIRLSFQTLRKHSASATQEPPKEKPNQFPAGEKEKSFGQQQNQMSLSEG